MGDGRETQVFCRKSKGSEPLAHLLPLMADFLPVLLRFFQIPFKNYKLGWAGVACAFNTSPWEVEGAGSLSSRPSRSCS